MGYLAGALALALHRREAATYPELNRLASGPLVVVVPLVCLVRQLAEVAARCWGVLVEKRMARKEKVSDLGFLIYAAGQAGQDGAAADTSLGAAQLIACAPEWTAAAKAALVELARAGRVAGYVYDEADSIARMANFREHYGLPQAELAHGDRPAAYPLLFCSGTFSPATLAYSASVKGARSLRVLRDRSRPPSRWSAASINTASTGEQTMALIARKVVHEFIRVCLSPDDILCTLTRVSSGDRFQARPALSR